MSLWLSWDRTRTYCYEDKRWKPGNLLTSDALSRKRVLFFNASKCLLIHSTCSSGLRKCCNVCNKDKQIRPSEYRKLCLLRCPRDLSHLEILPSFKPGPENRPENATLNIWSTQIFVADLILESLCRSNARPVFVAFYNISKFITVLTRSRYCSLTWAIYIKSSPSPSVTFKFHFNTRFHCEQGCPNRLFPSRFPKQNF